MKRHLKKPERLSFETLEPRVVMSASTTSATSNLLNLLFSINGSGKSRFGGFNQPKGLAGLTVNLINVADNEVVATTTTDARGNYHFDLT